MSFQFTYLGIVMLAAWSFSAGGLSIGNLLLGAAVLFSNSLSIAILLLIALSLFSFFLTSTQSRKSSTRLMQIAYSVRLLFLFTALVGAALEGFAGAPLLVLIGLLFSLPVFIWSILFSRHYESMTLKAFLYSVAIPAFVTLDVLLKSKTMIKAEWATAWDMMLSIVGVLTAVLASWIAFSKSRTKSKLIYLTQAWIGWAVFLLVVETDATARLAFAAISALAITSPVLVNLAKQLNRNFKSIALVTALGMPGFLAFPALFYSVKSIAALNVHWLWPFALAHLFLILSLMSDDSDPPETQPESPKALKVKFVALSLLQVACSAGLYLIEVGGLK